MNLDDMSQEDWEDLEKVFANPGLNMHNIRTIGPVLHEEPGNIWGRRIAAILLIGFLLIGGCGMYVFFSWTNLLSSGDDQPPQGAACAPSGLPNLAGKVLQFSDLDANQRANATIIVAVGAHNGATPRDEAIAVAVSMVEDRLRNSKVADDHDSVGLFQQRPSMGWGDKPADANDHRTPAQRLVDPYYSSARFYEKLLKVKNRTNRAFTDVAQAVQVSAFPLRYGHYETLGNSVVAAAIKAGVRVLFHPSPTPDCQQQQKQANANPGTVTNQVSAQGWVWPAPGGVGSRFHAPDRPDHQGQDITTSGIRGKTIVSASSGVVTKVTCNAKTNGVDVGCDHDGGLSVKGCGWYVEITNGVTQTSSGHATVLTRFCHMGHQPLVHVGEHVAAGTPLGVVGSSGNSTGPHCHFEVRLDGVPIDPLPWMQQHGVIVPGATS